MRTILIAAGGLLLAAALFAQTAATSAKKTAGLGKQEAASNEERNIRAYIELLRSDIRDSRTQIVGDVMALDATQAAKFWPIYKDFETEYAAVGEKIIAAVKKYVDDYADMTDAVADQLANQVLSIEQQRNALKKKYYDRFKESVGALTAARFLQVENQLERVTDLQIAAQLPVIGER
jgi:hypothetical protein